MNLDERAVEQMAGDPRVPALDVGEPGNEEEGEHRSSREQGSRDPRHPTGSARRPERRSRRRRRPKSVGRYESEEYHPYGTTSWWAESSTIQVSRKRYRYTGKEKDEETGLCYHGARYYMPWLGRWERADPAGMVDGPNRFAYVRWNPIGASDPTGLGATNAGSRTGVPLTRDAWVRFLDMRGELEGLTSGTATYNQRVGGRFEDVMLTHMNMMKNPKEFTSYERQKANLAAGRTGPGSVIPDVSGAIQQSTFFGVIEHADSAFVEIKTGPPSPRTLSTASNQFQILGMLDVLQRSPAAHAGLQPHLTFVTTADVVLDQSITQSAMSRFIDVFHATAAYDEVLDDSGQVVAVDIRLRGPLLVTGNPASAVETAGLFSQLQPFRLDLDLSDGDSSTWVVPQTEIVSVGHEIDTYSAPDDDGGASLLETFFDYWLGD